MCNITSTWFVIASNWKHSTLFFKLNLYLTISKCLDLVVVPAALTARANRASAPTAHAGKRSKNEAAALPNAVQAA
ncbi:hypothetical protein CDAR_249811 [Caerostris darwini]|uniref:Uncharacterized protein n=1 Tax=Caerostris darwini TaxID=1538125 RepID=A0AAV4UTX5_9ARAC|nr:hypothetical protein CDAR_249811 [Caerostris darwini]